MPSIEHGRAALHRCAPYPTELLDLALACLIAGGHLLLQDASTGQARRFCGFLATALGASVRCLDLTAHAEPSQARLVGDDADAPVDLRRLPVPGGVSIALVVDLEHAPRAVQYAWLDALDAPGPPSGSPASGPASAVLIIGSQEPRPLTGPNPLLPEQRDHFMVATRLGFPDQASEARMIADLIRRSPVAGPPLAVTRAVLMAWTRAADRIEAEPAVPEYVVALCSATRGHPAVRQGAGPGGSVSLLGAARALACIQGRSVVQPGDVARAAVPALAHRLDLQPDALVRGTSPADVIEEILIATPAPQVA